MYLAIFLSLFVDVSIFEWQTSLGMWTRLLLGIVFFIPAVIQLQWKSQRKLIKFAMRFSLGISIWFLFSTILYGNSLLLRLVFSCFLILGAYIYATLQASKQLLQCDQCRFNQKYDSCLIKFQDLLSIDNLELVEHEHPVIQQVLDLKRRANHDKAILLPTSEYH